MRFGTPKRAHAIDYRVPHVYKVFIIEVIDAVNFLKADDASITLRNFFDDARASEAEV